METKEDVDVLSTFKNGNTIIIICNKEDLEGLQRRWCCLIGALVFLSFITLLSTSIFSLSSFHSNGSPPPTNTMTTIEDTSIAPADMVGAPRFMSRKGWVAQPPTEPLDNNTLPVQRVIVCHTASDPCQTTPECTLQVRYIQQYHVESQKWGDIGYNFLIGGEGVVYVGRGWDVMGAHTKGENNGTLGVAFIGTYINKLPNELQIAAFQKLVDVGIRIGKIADDYKLQAQCQLQVTAAPGLMLAQNMKSWPHFDTSLRIRCTDGGVS
uniref:Peptidoglycan recognition protein family domain-containing protein n=1 Tax=Cuerna arida TaxID=1464854 RepID=A0A1B6EI02_9HEMI